MIDDGDAYSISFAKNGNDMKLNGSTDNPLLENVKAALSGKALLGIAPQPEAAPAASSTTTPATTEATVVIPAS